MVADSHQRPTPLRRRLSGFTGRGYDKGRSTLVQALWFAVLNLVFVKWWCPRRARVTLLRAFGANIGENVFIRHRVRVLWPWKLAIGDDSWIGEDAWLLNLEPITIGADVCVSQAVSLITGSHDRRSETFEYDNAPISIMDGAWLAFGATILRGVLVGPGATIAAHAVVRDDVEAGELRR